jgi:hypothetical protein
MHSRNVKIKRVLCLFIFPFYLLIFNSPLAAFDFNLILDQSFGVGGTGNNSDFDYSGSLIPSFSGLVGGNGKFFLSAGIEAGYREDLTFTPELLQTDLLLNFGRLDLRFGRMIQGDPLGFVATGLFDGARVSYDFEAGTLSGGVWYTGLQYKNRAMIAMTDKELETLAEPVDKS